MTLRVVVFIGAVAAGALAAAAAAASLGLPAADGAELAAFAVVTLSLQLYSLRLPGAGRIGVSAVGAVACAFALGTGYGMALAAASGIVQWARSRGLFHRAVFDVSQLTLATGAAGLVYVLANGETLASTVAAALLGGLAYAVVNQTLVSVAIGLSEGLAPLAVWRQRLRVGRFHYVANGPLALAWAGLAAAAGPLGIVLFAVVPIAMLASLRPLVARLRAAPLPASSEA